MTTVMRVAEFDHKPAFHEDPERLAAFQAWLASQPGFRRGWHASDPASGRTVSVSIWDSRNAVLALKTRPFPGGPLGAKPDRVFIYDHVEEL